MNTEGPFSVDLTVVRGYELSVRFGQAAEPVLTIDEHAPTGTDRGPDPSEVLGAAIGGCLSASLLFCLGKARIETRGMTIHVAGVHTRNERGRLRLGTLTVTLSPAVSTEGRERMQRCREIFEDFCVVTESVRHGITVDVRIEPQVN